MNWIWFVVSFIVVVLLLGVLDVGIKILILRNIYGKDPRTWPKDDPF